MSQVFRSYRACEPCESGTRLKFVRDNYNVESLLLTVTETCPNASRRSCGTEESCLPSYLLGPTHVTRCQELWMFERGCATL